MNKGHLMLICVILAMALLVGGVNVLTAGARQANAQEEWNNKLLALLPGSESFTEEAYAGEDSSIRAAYKAENGYVVYVVTTGYAGDIAMLVGVSNEGYVTGLQIRDMSETLGLGARALTDWEFLVQFLATDGNAQVGEDIDAITGATVTSKAVARGVNSAVAFVTGADTSSGATAWGG